MGDAQPTAADDRMKQESKKAPCTEASPNGSLKCDLKFGHPGPHRDGVRQIMWNHPQTPYGVRKKRGG